MPQLSALVVEFRCRSWLIGLASAALVGGFVALFNPLADDPIWLTKAAFICNPIAAVDAAVIAKFGTNIAEKVLGQTL